MKKFYTFKKAFLFLVLLIGFFSDLLSQPQFYNSNTGATSNLHPFAVTTGKEVQWLIRANEFNKPSYCPSGYNISTIWFRINGTATVTYTNLTIKLGQTTDTSLPLTAIYTGALTTVYYKASVSLTSTSGSFMGITLDTQFPYNPSQSIIIDVSQCSATATSQPLWHFSPPGGLRRRTYINAASCVFSYSGQDATSPDCGITLCCPSPLSGTKVIDNTGGGNYTSFTAAINDLNYCGVGPGGVTFNVVSGQTFSEIPPQIIATGTASNPIIFQKSGGGANPVVQSSISGSGTITGSSTGGWGDAFFKLVGTDYLTFDGIDVKDIYATVTTSLSMEYGYLLLRKSSTDGCKNVTIKNCNIQLNYQYQYSQGIGLINYNGSGTATNPTTMDGRHENIYIYSNTITNVYHGIYINGYNDATSPYSLYENNIQIGVGGANTIRNNSYVSGSTSYGIYAIYADSLKIANNNFSSGQVGAVQANLYTFWSIYLSNGTNSNADIYGNTFQDTSFATTTQVAVIGNAMGASGTNNTVNIYNNTIQNCVWNTATTGAFYGIYNTAAAVNPEFLNVYGNTVTNCSYGSASVTGTGTVYYIAIYGNSTSSGSIYNVYNNNVTNNSRTQSATGAGNTYYLYVPGSALTLNINGNNISNNLSQTTGTLYCLYFTSAPTVSVSINCFNNVINNNGYSSGTTTGLFYGIYDASLGTGGGTVSTYNNVVKNINLTNRTSGYLYTYYISSSYGTHNIYGDTAANNTSYYIQYGIQIATVPPTVNINNNCIYGLNCTSTNTIYGICKDNYTGTSTVSIYNNNIFNINPTTSAQVYGIYTYYGTTVNVYGNNVYNISSPTTVYGLSTYGYSSSPYTNISVNNNNFYSLSSTGSIVYGLYCRYSANADIYQNNIYNLTSTSTIYGMYLYYAYNTGTTHNIYRNNVYGFSSTSTGSIYGIYRYANTITTNNIFRNNIYNLSTNYLVGSTYGIYTNSTTVNGAVFNTYNNFISELKTTTSGSSITPYLVGIYHSAGAYTYNCNDYYNTIYLNGTSSSASFSSACIYATDNAYMTLDMRNNILVNNSIPGSSGINSVLWRSAGTNLATMYSANSNNNCFYSGMPGATRLIYYDGTNSDQTLASFQSRVDPRDNMSVTELPAFLNVSVSPFNLHLNSTVPTQLESGASVISSPISITTDYDNDPRYPNPGYPVGSFTPVNPDIGADEFGGIGTDLAGPYIGFTALSNTTSTSNRSFTNVTIMDKSGVETTTGLRPRCYYKKSYNSNTFISNSPSNDGWKWVEANCTSSPFDFTIDYSLLYGGSANTGDQIMYFVVSQDAFVPPNVSNKYGTFASPQSSVNLNSSAFPINGAISNYLICSAAPLAGDYTVGLGMYNLLTGKNLVPKEFTRQTTENKKIVEEKYIALSENGKEYKGSLYVKYTSEMKKKYNLSDNLTGNYGNLTSAFGDAGVVGISSSVRFLLLDANYGATGTPETLPITFSQITGACSGATITIQPQSGVSTTISGANTNTIFDISGGDYFIIDGRPNGSTTPKQLTIRNTSMTANASTIRFINDATYNVIQYATIEGCGTSLGTSGTIYFASSSGTTGNDYNIIQYNDIRDRSDATGYPTTSILNVGSLSNDYVQILNNNIYNTYNSTASCCDLYLNGGLGKWTISGNSFYQTSTRSPSNLAAYFAMILTSTSDSFYVSNNYLGGTAPMCGGTPLTYTDGAGFLSFRFWQTGSTNPSVFSGNTITNIDYSNTSTSSAMFFRAADVASSTGTTVNVTNNTIGSSSGLDAIVLRYNPISSAGSPTPTPIAYGMTGALVASWPAGLIQNNVIGGITLTGTGTTTGTVTLQGISLSSYCQNVTVSGNTIGNSTLQNFRNLLPAINTSVFGVNSQVSAGYIGATTIQNNTIKNLFSASATSSATNIICGIFHSGSDSVLITGNTIQEINSLTQYSFLSSSASVFGIGTSSGSTLQNIIGNTITGIRSSTTSTVNTNVAGIENQNAASVGTIARNRIYDLTNTSTGDSPCIIGIYNNYGTWSIVNNQLTVTNGEATDNLKKISQNSKIMTKTPIINNKIENNNDVFLTNAINNKRNNKTDAAINNAVTESYIQIQQFTDVSKTINSKRNLNDGPLSTNGLLIYGILDNTSAIGNYYYNSVYIGGCESSGSTNSYCLYRMGTPNIILGNNLLYNGRTNLGATGKHYAIGTPNSSSLTSNYNAFVTTDANTFALWNGTDQTFSQWKSSSSADAQSYATTGSVISASNLFNNISNGNLNILSGNSEAWLVSGKGIFISGQSTDFDGSDTRSTSLSGGVTDIGSDEFSATPPNCPVAIESGAPAEGITTSYSIFGRTIASITWGTGGSSYPTGMNVIYYSGVTPPSSSGNNAYSYYSVTPTGTLSGTTYDITTCFTDAETYSIINPTTDTRIAKFSSSQWFVFLEQGTGCLQTELNWSGKWAKVRGLDAFSLFSFSDITTPLPVQLSSFSSSVSGRDINLKWIVASEHNNAGYEIQRINNSELNSGNWIKLGFVKSNGNSSSNVTYSYEDKKVNSGKYNYRLKQIDILGNFRYFLLDNVIDLALPVKFNLSQNYPNPFNPVTKIDYDLPYDSRVNIVVYDVLGREIKKLVSGEFKKAGYYTLEFNSLNLSSGIYFYRMTANSQGKDYVFTKKMVITK